MAENLELLKRQTNALIECIRKRPYFSFDAFEYSNKDNHYIIYLKSNKRFQFQIEIDSNGSDRYVVIIFPFQSLKQGTLQVNWKYLIKLFDNWLTVIWEEAKGEDWWSNLKNLNFNIKTDSNFSSKKFTNQEKMTYKAEFDDLKIMIMEIADMTADELAIIRDEIENLKEKIDVLNKPDMMKQIIGSMVSYIPHVVSEKIYDEIIRLFKNKLFSESNLLTY